MMIRNLWLRRLYKGLNVLSTASLVFYTSLIGVAFTPTSTTAETETQEVAQSEPVPDLTVIKNVREAPDGTVTFAIHAENVGGATAYAVEVTDTLPLGFTVESTDPALPADVAGPLVWQFFALEPETGQDITITGRFDDGQLRECGQQTNAVTVFDNRFPVPVPNDFQTEPQELQGDNSASATTELRYGPCSSIAGLKFRDHNLDGNWSEGEESGWGGITINLYEGDGEDPIAETTTEANGSFSFADLPQGTYRVCEVVPEGAVATTDRCVEDIELDGRNNSYPEKGTLAIGNATLPDLVLDKVFMDVHPAFPDYAIDEFDFLLGIFNMGDMVAENVVVTDTPPPGFVFEDSTLENGTSFPPDAAWIPGTPLVWTLATLGSGLQHNVRIFVRGHFDQALYAAQMGAEATCSPLTNTASVTMGETPVTTSNHAAPMEVNTANNTDSITTQNRYGACGSGVTLQKTDNREMANPGDTLTYTLTLTSVGPEPAPNVIVTDPVPSSCAAVANISDGGTQNEGVITWSLGTVPVGNRSLTFDCTLNATFSEGTTEVVNTAQACIVAEDADRASACADARDATNVTVAPQGTPGEPPTNPPQVPNQPGIVITPTIALDKTDGKDPVKPGEAITYILTYTVKDAAVTGLVLTDELPLNVSFVSATHGGSFNNEERSVTWTLGTIQPGTYVENVTVQPNPTVSNGTVLTNNATLDSAENALVRDTETTLVSGNPILSVAKKADRSPVNPGDTVQYTVTIANAGAGEAKDVKLADTLPTGFTFADTNLTAMETNVGTIAVGGAYTTTYNVKVGDAVPTGTYENSIVVTASNHDRIATKAPVVVQVVTVLGVTQEAPGEVLGAESLPDTGLGFTDVLLASLAALLVAGGAFSIRRVALEHARNP